MYRIRDLREDRDYTQVKIAKVIMTTQPQYSKIEMGKADISGEKLILLSKFYNVSVDYILGLKKIIRKDQMCYVTLGSKGSLFMYQDDILSVPTFKVDPVDTTGAGDAFYSCVLYYLDNMESYSLDYIHDTLLHANICGGLACTKLGAISALPSYSELENKYNELLKSYILK